MYALTVALDAAVPVVVGALVSCPDNRVDRHGTASFGAVECDVPPCSGVVTVQTNIALVDYVEGGVVLGLYEDTILNGTRTRVPIRQDHVHRPRPSCLSRHRGRLVRVFQGFRGHLYFRESPRRPADTFNRASIDFSIF